MEPLEFLATVLPTSGTYCLAELTSKKKEHVYATSLQELQPHLARFEAEKLNTYFALASFTKAGSRTADNAQFMRALFLDIDCGEGKSYPTKKLAVQALDAFLAASRMPAPWVVDSGGGVHVYWPFTQHVTVADWKPVAENLKRLCKQHGLGIDFTVTSDAARVLRVIGTTNWKYPKPVVLRVTGSINTFAELSASVLLTLQDPHDEASPLFNVPGTRLEPTGPSLVKVLENRVTFFKAILDRTAAGTGCSQLAHYLEHASEDGMEPLWRGLLSQAKVCADGEKASKFLSKLHPYSDSRMQQKLKEIKGPYPCVKFDSECPGICPSCPHWGKITNPLALGHEVQTDNTPKQVEIPATDAQAASTTITRPSPPHGFAYGAKGGVYRLVETEDAEGNPVKSHKLILPYDLFVVDLLDGGKDGHLVQLVATRPEGAVQMTIQSKALVSKDETVKALAQQNILAAYGAGNDRFLFDYVRGCAEEVSASRRAIRIPESFGWQDNDTFVFSGNVYSPMGEQEIPMPRLRNIIKATRPTGTVEDWRQVVQMLINKGHYDILAMSLVAFGSPLMQFSADDTDALTFHIGSSETGTGKSLALTLASSVWGSKKFIMNPHASAIAQEHRMGILNNLPLIIDEITESNKDFEWISAFVMDMTLGQGKERMMSSANEERDNYTNWRALMLLASNKHITDFFSAVRKQMSEGHLRRFLELKMETKIEWEPEEKKLLKLLRTNKGIAAHTYVRWLVRNVDTVKRVYDKVYWELDRRVNASGDERFWIAGCAANIAAGVLISSKYAGIVDLPMQAIGDVYIKMIKEARATVRANKRNAEDILNAYTAEFYGNFVVVQINDQTKTMETSFGNGGIIDKSLVRSQVKGRVEHDIVPKHIRYMIEERQMKAWCSTMNYGYADFKRQIEQEFVVSYGIKDLLAKTRGPQMRTKVMIITRPESNPADDGSDDLSLEQDA